MLILPEHEPIHPIVAASGNYSSNFIEQRQILKPLEITQPQGPSFVVDGNQVTVWIDWHQNWLILKTKRFYGRTHGHFMLVSLQEKDLFYMTWHSASILLWTGLQVSALVSLSIILSFYSSRHVSCVTSTGTESTGIKTVQNRKVIFRASLCEMTVPYGDPRSQHVRKNAFDAGK